MVVVNYGSHALLERNLAPLGNEVPPLNVIVVDNLLDEPSRTSMRELALRQNWTFVPAESNLGFGAGMNIGVATAVRLGAEAVLLLNPDASISASNLRQLLLRLGENPRAVVMPRILNPNGSLFAAGTDLLLDNGRMRGTARRPATGSRPYAFWLSGACMLLTTALWEEIGGFDEDYFLYWEDVDLCVRAAGLGAQLAVCDSATAVHDEGGTQNSPAVRSRVQPKSSLYYYYNTKNRLVFASKHLTREDQRRWARTSVSAAYHILRRGGRRQFVNPRATLVPAIRGTYDGLRELHAARA